MTHPIKVIQGSKGAGKTYSILMKWILRACCSEERKICTVVSDTVPTLRRGAIRDFVNICTENGIPFSGTKTPYVFKIRNHVFEFYSVDKEAKARGGRMDCLFINEADRVSWRIARHLIGRTHGEVILDFNPVTEFWAHTQFVNVNSCDFIKLTYKDNEMLPAREVESIERHAPWGEVPDDNYWRVYGLGEIGFVEGMVFKNFKTFSEYPEGRYLEAIGVDFGDVDPMAATYVRYYPRLRELYLKELFYASEADLPDLIKSVSSVAKPKGMRLYCDHNPKMIRQMRQSGLAAFKAIKKYGLISDIRVLKQNKIYVHESSKMLNAEMMAYKYQQKHDMFTNYPDQTCEEHAIDAARYGAIPLI